MATREVHDEHIAQIFGNGSVLTTPEYVRLIQNGVYLLMDSTVKDKNAASLTDALQQLKDLRIADIAPDDIVALESAANAHQYYAHRGWNYDYETDGLLEQENTAEWRRWTSEQQNEFKTYLAVCQKRFMLGKEIVIKSIEKAFPSFSSERAEARARICYSFFTIRHLPCLLQKRHQVHRPTDRYRTVQVLLPRQFLYPSRQA